MISVCQKKSSDANLVSAHVNKLSEHFFIKPGL